MHDRYDGRDAFKIRDWKEKHKLLIKTWVNEEYSAQKTGIHFVGWKDCDNDPRANVVLFYNKKSLLLTSIIGGSYIKGRSGALGAFQNSVPGYPSAENSIIISDGGIEKGSVVHEFGHVAGLAHEHTHPDAARKGRDCDKVRPSYHPSYGYTPYDKDSIMSYCALEKKATSLSKSDIKLLKKLYSGR